MGSEEVFILGTEHELASAALSPDGVPLSVDNREAYETISQELRNSGVPYLFDYASSGLFCYLGRVYLETAGFQVEFAACPGCSPYGVVQAEAKMMHLLREAITRARRRIPGLTLLHNNYDYVTRCTWGQHSSYAIQVPLHLLRRALVPFLVTRQVYAGSGGIDNDACAVCLSPRAKFMALETDGSTTSDRSIYSTTRDEPLMQSPRFIHRLHLILGCSLMSEFGQWLKLGTTALVIRAAEQKPDIGEAVALPDPVASIRMLSRLTPDGTRLFSKSLLTIQEHYLHVVADMLERGDFPSWCHDVWQSWDDTLRTLESDPMALDKRLDPYIKLRVYEQLLKQRKKRWKDVWQEPSLYYDLALLDVQYHALCGGLFEMLDAEGVLDHRMFSEGEAIPGLEDEPYVLDGLPRETYRSRKIKELNGSPDHRCDWQHITDIRERVRLEMPDPLTPHEGAWHRIGHREMAGAYGVEPAYRARRRPAPPSSRLVACPPPPPPPPARPPQPRPVIALQKLFTELAQSDMPPEDVPAEVREWQSTRQRELEELRQWARERARQGARQRQADARQVPP